MRRKSLLAQIDGNIPFIGDSSKLLAPVREFSLALCVLCAKLSSSPELCLPADASGAASEARLGRRWGLLLVLALLFFCPCFFPEPLFLSTVPPIFFSRDLRGILDTSLVLRGSPGTSIWKAPRGGLSWLRSFLQRSGFLSCPTPLLLFHLIINYLVSQFSFVYLYVAWFSSSITSSL